ncbi:MAG: response regulator transcription factor [Candidatus Marinarcus sp.]|uniref:response regulator transcription factor n=1 Tax=Candidatus Marinarcus sp. TaxID=3100987 RepID=UPI003B001A7E
METLKNLKKLKVLLVEDEVKLSKFLKDAIGEYFADFAIAEDGNDGIKKFKKLKPDVIITDIMMPNLDGLEMSKAIRKIKKDTHVIVLSAHSHKDKLLKAIDIGINKYFIKPFDTDEVLLYLNNIAQEIKSLNTIKINSTYSYDKSSRSLYFNGVIMKLSKRERDFFHLLMSHQNAIVDAEKIKQMLWSDENDVPDERLRTFIKRLRAKTSKTLIDNISGQGYILSKR